MAIYVYRSDGTLVSWCPNDTDPVASAAELQSLCLTVVYGLPALDNTHAWDAANKTVVSVTPVGSMRIITGKWVLRFTPTEHQAIKASADPVVDQLWTAVTCTASLNLSDPTVINGVNYLVSISLLNSSRVAAILAVPTGLEVP